jgi:hypothetical protein
MDRERQRYCGGNITDITLVENHGGCADFWCGIVAYLIAGQLYKCGGSVSGFFRLKIDTIYTPPPQPLPYTIYIGRP